MALTRRDFSYELPPHLIAQAPLAERSASRLLVVDPRLADGVFEHRTFRESPELLNRNDLLVLNDTRVLPARLYAVKDSGGRLELLIERIESPRRALCQVRASKALRPDRTLSLQPTGEQVRVVARCGDLYRLEFARSVEQVLQHCGRVPLPPYIEREPDEHDATRYQTVYARESGSVAAPTAGLHFDAALLQRCAAKGIASVQLTLHVGAGTFQPLRSDDLDAHRMHSERVRIDDDVVRAVAACRARGGRVVAVGTTVVRALETAAQRGALTVYDGETAIFIRPGFRFGVVDALLTNLHLPESTLLMLVAAFGGRRRVLAAYAEAVRQRYRFFSYGDAMFIPARAPNDAV
jgi:S-adenosylmethionine:tRNA ribosyltransferase-isomerase